MVTEGTAQIRPFLIADAAGDRLRNGRATYGTMPATGFAMGEGPFLFEKPVERLKPSERNGPCAPVNAWSYDPPGGYFTFLMNRITTGTDRYGRDGDREY